MNNAFAAVSLLILTSPGNDDIPYGEASSAPPGGGKTPRFHVDSSQLPSYNGYLFANGEESFFETLLKWNGLLCPKKYVCKTDSIRYTYSHPCSPYFCGGCSCEDCQFGGCCMDMGLESFENSLTCLTGTPKAHSLNDVDWFYFVNSCPHSNTNASLKSLCEKQQPLSSFESMKFPVYSNNTQTNYVNEFCAECHGDTTDLVSWSPDVRCSGYVRTPPGLSLSALKELLFQNSLCTMTSRPPNGAKVRPCYNYQNITTCNQTGLWQSYDENIDRACKLYWSNIRINSQTYRNIFCAFCNGLSPLTIIKAMSTLFECASPPTGDTGTDTVSFSLIFNMNPPEPQASETDTAMSCANNEVFNPHTDSCRRLVCAAGRIAAGHTCTGAFQSAMGVGYRVRYRLVPDPAPHRLDTLREEISGIWNTYLNSVPREKIYFFKGLYQPWSKTILTAFFSENNATGLLVHFFELQFYVVIGRDWTQDSVEKGIVDFFNHTWEFDGDLWYPELHTFNQETQTNNLSEIRHTEEYRSKRKNVVGIPTAYFTQTDIYITLDKFTDCNQIELNIPEYSVDLKTGDIELRGWSGETRKASDYLESDAKIRICVNFSGVKIVKNQAITTDNGDPIETVLTFGSIITSLICLFLALVVCLLVDAKRKVPGKITIILLSSLFVAQLLYLVSGHARGTRWPCRLLGLVTHYMWLVVFAWKNVAAYHMYVVFTGPLKTLSSQPRRSLFLYSLYSFVLPLFLVVAYVLVRQFLVRPRDFGYGGSVCFLSRPIDIGLAFVTPIGIILVANAYLFARSIYAIRQMSELEKVSNRANASQTALFLKMSLILGFTWVIGFLANIVSEPVVWYIFIVLNGGVGILLFGSQITNQHVLSRLMELAFPATRETTITATSQLSNRSQKSVLGHGVSPCALE